MFGWKIINDEYLNYLRDNFEPKIPRTDYGENKMKPFFGELFETSGFVYVTQVTSPKPRHKELKQSIDFYKIIYNNRIISAVNLNYMFPVPKTEIFDLKYGNIDNYIIFLNENQRSRYIKLLQLEMNIIKGLPLKENSELLYYRKYELPNDNVSKRCFDFKNLEIGAAYWSEHKNEILSPKTADLRK